MALKFSESQSKLFIETGIATGDAELIEELVHCLNEDESEGAELIVELRKVLHDLHHVLGSGLYAG